MPTVSGPQYRLFAGRAHGWKPKSGKLKSHLPSKEVAEEFVHATPKKKRSLWSKK